MFIERTEDTAPIEVPPVDAADAFVWNARTVAEARVLHRQLLESAAWWGFLGPFGWDVGHLAVSVTVNGRTALMRVRRPSA